VIRLIDSQSDYVEDPEQYVSYSDSSVRVVDETLLLPVQDMNVENCEGLTTTLTRQEEAKADCPEWLHVPRSSRLAVYF